jgi:hypothetical protein
VNATAQPPKRQAKVPVSRANDPTERFIPVLKTPVLTMEYRKTEAAV